MDFNQKDLIKALDSLRDYTAGVPEDLSAFNDPKYAARLQGFLATKYNGLKQQTTAGVKAGVSAADALDKGELALENMSPRGKLAQQLSTAKPTLSGSHAGHLEYLAMAQLAALDHNGALGDVDLSYFKLDSVISSEENTLLQAMADYHKTGNSVNLKEGFTRASAQYEARQQAELNAKLAAQDESSIDAGLRELGFQIDGPEDVREALAKIMTSGHQGLQISGRSADYANEHYGNANIHTQWTAIYDPDTNNIKDAGMAREVVASALTGRQIDFKTMLESGDPIQIKEAEKLAHIIDPSAGVIVDGTIDEQTISVANKHLASVGQTIPNQLLSTAGDLNKTAVIDFAKQGGLPAVADSHLTDEQRLDFELLGGAHTQDGQAYLADLININGKDWYVAGLNKLEKVTLDITASKITPEVMKLTEGRNYPPEVLESVSVFDTLPDAIPDDAPDDIVQLVTAKNDLIAAQIQAGDPTTGNFKIGGFQPDGSYLDLHKAKADLANAENTYSKLEADIRAGGRWEDVQKYLLDQKPDEAPAIDDKSPDGSDPAAPSVAIDYKAAPPEKMSEAAPKGDRLVGSIRSAFDESRFGGDATPPVRTLDDLRKTPDPALTAGM